MTRALAFGAGILLCLALGLACEIGHVRRRRLDLLLARQMARLNELPLVQQEYPETTTSTDPAEQARVKATIRTHLTDLITTDDSVAKRDHLLDRYRFQREDIRRQRAVGHIDAATAAAGIGRCDELIAELEGY